MKIYSMTATFGKLENQTLTLQPGLNVISAPNEWGKSTWCAFLVNMLYGLETRVKTTKNTIADKDRYAPWSGAPMSGRIELCWNGRDITIERWTKGRTPMGEFRAYETNTGMEVAELTATTCGEMLLGVERSVFLRAGFLRLTDLPVTEDEPLRRRLNALVTTGDESGAADVLGQKLKDLKNKCRSNRTNGLLPVAESEKAELERKLSDLQNMDADCRQLTARIEDLNVRIQLLENHEVALRYAEGEENIRRVASANAAAEAAAAREAALYSQCADLPSEQEARDQLENLQRLNEQQQQLHLQAQMLPQPPQMPNDPHFAYGTPASQVLQQVQADLAEYGRCVAEEKAFPVLLLCGALAGVLGMALMLLHLLIPGGILLGAAVALLILHSVRSGKQKAASMARLAKAEALRARYGGMNAENWLPHAQAYARRWEEYEIAQSQYQQNRLRLQQQLSQLERAMQDATEGERVTAALERWKKVISLREDLRAAQKETQRTRSYAADLAAVVKPMQKPELEDVLTYSVSETRRMLEENRLEQQRLQQTVDQFRGKMEALGDPAILRRQLDACHARIDRLADTYAALELAQETLAAATAQLQRRFAPRIASEAQNLLGRMTDGRYDRLTISQDMSLNVASGEETVLRAAQRRSEGTVDQIYLALRLAVSKELTPDAPMVLDDALVRFDDVRHAAAMKILKEESCHRQIILFTCQSREQS